ncbi:MAG: B12-binding domain-containing radical SAM protein [Candidatus Riflebacteria bacterium]|nr:B12-binding domain-containing radical SAM protein [Candidatus Riflebacteria bacterium]
MKLTLIMPSIGRKPNQPYVSTWQMEPLVLALLAALSPADWQITVQDDRMEEINYDQPTDLVAITIETYTARRAYQIAREYQKRGVKVVMGGYHASLWPHEVLQHADATVIGPAETIWEKVLCDAKAGKLEKEYLAPPLEKWHSIFPRREIYSEKKYLPLALVEFSRGCRFHCSFCSITALSKGRHYFRPPAEVAEEIKRTGQKVVFLIDDNIAVNYDAALELCRQLKPLNVKWVSQISVDAACRVDLIKAMADAGCMGLLIGFESLNPKLISRLNKKCNGSIEAYETALKIVHQNKICVYGTFLFGIDGDTPASFKHTLDFILRHKLFLAAFNHLVPFPGTPLYAKLQAENRLISDAWWLDSDFRFGKSPFKPTGFTIDELAELCRRYRRKFYSLRSIIKRGFDLKANMQNFSTAALFFSQNYFGRREVDEKFGLPLGFQDS